MLNPFDVVTLGTVEVLRGECSEGEGQRLYAVAAICRTVLPGLNCLLCAYKENILNFSIPGAEIALLLSKKTPNHWKDGMPSIF